MRQKHPGIEEAWILRVMAEPLEGRRQADGSFALWGLVPEGRFPGRQRDRSQRLFRPGVLKARTRSQPTLGFPRFCGQLLRKPAH